MVKKHLTFDVSSGLKSVLGGELITDDEVAVFELVKNSFDADATAVELYFDDDTVIIADDGVGMSYDDLQKKWLFVAYSSKRDVSRKSGFREEIAKRRHYAGSKGIGRFSSDRLGKLVILQTRQNLEDSKVHSLTVNWELFDEDHQNRFEAIGVEYESLDKFTGLPDLISPKKHGTVIEIKGLRRIWDRNSILRLKSALAKLINPFGSNADEFKITVHAPKEIYNDEVEQLAAKKRNQEDSSLGYVNGAVGNFIFETLQSKTTYIEVSVNSQDNQIHTKLIDRGELIYEILEPNIYPLLKSSGFKCQVFFLNQSAKTTFTRRMGIPSVQFGSVFLFRNGFRVFPIGEEGDDWFKLDRRKAQGYARFLGTRDVIGRIDVFGADSDFREASSRNAGLIETPAVAELRACFRDHCLRRLENYVVPVTFVDKEDKNTSDVSRLLTDPGRARVSAVVAKLVDSDEITLVDYSKRLVGIINERSLQFESSLASLRSIAKKTQDKDLFSSIELAEKKFEELKKAEEHARKQADLERKAKEEAHARAVAAEAEVAQKSEQLIEEKKRTLFLSSIATLDTETIMNLHHQITIYAVDLHQKIENFILDSTDSDSIAAAEVIDAMEGMSLLTSKIMGIARFATKANFRLESEMIKDDLSEYIGQYIESVAKDFLFGPIRVEFSSDGKPFVTSFKPIDVSIVIDNLIFNSRKARAHLINIDVTLPSKDTMYISVKDNGRGFDSMIEDLNRIFEKGFSKTDGSGLGLYHVRQVLGEMSGTIEASRRSQEKGAEFSIRISK